ncbi:MAG: DciA family protein [Phycisphaeraceae bacterium]
MAIDPVQEHLDRLRADRSLPKRDLSLGFLTKQFKKDVAKPFKQLGDLSDLWRELLPSHLVERTRLVGLSRGVLHVEVDNPAAHFEIDRLLRGGLQKQLIEGHKGPAFRKVQVKVLGRNESGAVDARRLPPEGDTNPKLSPERQAARGRRRDDSGDD